MKAKYEAPQMEIISIETTTLLAGSDYTPTSTRNKKDYDDLDSGTTFGNI